MQQQNSFNKLIRILWVQEVDLYFSSKGYKRTYIHEKIIERTFFISYKTYSAYLGINAKKQIKQHYGIDWNKEKMKHKPVNFFQIMKDLNEPSRNFSKETLEFLNT